MNEPQTEIFLEKKGLPVVQRALIKSKASAEAAAKKFGFPFVLKIISTAALHKSAIGGVEIVYSHQELEQAYSRLKGISEKINGGLLGQRFVKGKELLVGLKADQTFGYTIIFGLGGVLTEQLKDVSIRILPVSAAELAKMPTEIKSKEMLKNCNMKAIIAVLKKVAGLAKPNFKILELDINPLIVNEKKAVVADARAIFKE